MMGDPGCLRILLCLALLGVGFGFGRFSSASGLPPRIASLLKAGLWERMVSEKQILVHAGLSDLTGDEKRYSFYAAMLVRASLEQTRQTLTDYRLYSEVIPYVDKAVYTEPLKTLLVEGGIWKYRLQSQVLFEEKMDRWIHYQIKAGSFQGLSGDIFFESLGEKGTAVYFRGEQTGNVWPPKFIIERGAEVVFQFTAHKMRSLIESRKRLETGDQNEKGKGEGIPKPRTHL